MNWAYTTRRILCYRCRGFIWTNEWK